jgi:hypothetical protein
VFRGPRGERVRERLAGCGQYLHATRHAAEHEGDYHPRPGLGFMCNTGDIDPFAVAPPIFAARAEADPSFRVFPLSAPL